MTRPLIIQTDVHAHADLVETLRCTNTLTAKWWSLGTPLGKRLHVLTFIWVGSR